MLYRNIILGNAWTIWRFIKNRKFFIVRPKTANFDGAPSCDWCGAPPSKLKYYLVIRQAFLQWFSSLCILSLSCNLLQQFADNNLIQQQAVISIVRVVAGAVCVAFEPKRDRCTCIVALLLVLRLPADSFRCVQWCPAFVFQIVYTTKRAACFT